MPTGRWPGCAPACAGVRAARVVIADDDVRYEPHELAAAVHLLEHSDLVVPQNYFRPLPWHCRWDTARSLLNRAFGHDYPGTLAVRREAFHRLGCYDGNVLFENLELIRTVQARGGTVRHAPALLVRRLPPAARVFLSQRVRQAYDSFAQPARLAAELAILPVAAALARRGGAGPWGWRWFRRPPPRPGAGERVGPRCSRPTARCGSRCGWPSAACAAGWPWCCGCCAAAWAIGAGACKWPRIRILVWHGSRTVNRPGGSGTCGGR
ncbi:glycosyltransferase [Amycolatopsis magusensis]|uniref:glycosyltransferase n=1 Tax=Amycolatopsis magusensis TaxID=882444 RepID=UPI0037B431CB